MKKEKDHWQGGLQHQFDHEEALVPEEAWDLIEKNIKPKSEKKRAFVVLLSLVMVSSSFLLFQLGLNQNSFGDSIQSKNKKKELSKGTKPLDKTTAFKRRSLQISTKQDQSNPIENQADMLIIKNKYTKSIYSLDFILTDQQVKSNLTEKETEMITSIPRTDSSKRNLGLAFLKPSLFLVELGHLIQLKKQVLNTWEVTFFGGFGFDKRVVKGNFSIDNKKSRDLGESAFNAETKQIGFNLEKKVSSHFSIGTSILWNQTNYSSNWFFRQLYLQPYENSLFLNSPEGKLNINDPGFLDDFSNGDTLLYKLRASFKTNAISIPLYVSLEHTIGRITPYAKGGLLIELQNKVSSAIQTFQFGQLKDLSNQIERSKIQASMGGMASLGVKFGITKNLSLNIEERFQLAITPLVKYNGLTLKNNCLFTNFGISYTITQPKHRK